ncbi:MAG: hypothetical protein PVJ76_09960 [Gemmatimonadota bacterium]|jgi:hypothetical protein
MRIKGVLGIGVISLTVAVLAWGFATGKAAARRWGSDGHRMAARAAHAILPSRMPDFFLEAAPQLEYLSPEPDRWRNGDLRAMDEAWKYDHYIDLENVPPGALDAPDRFEFLEALFEAGVERPQQYVGFLPFRILELHQRLVSGFARWRMASPGSDRDWIEARILNDAGILGHYVVDAAQPHHTTIHFNGWAESVPNPRGFTTDREFHSRFESGFVRAHITFEDLPPLMPPSPMSLGDVRKAIWDHVQASNATVEEMYELEKEYGFDPGQQPRPEARHFAIERLAAGAEMLASVWWTAWEESEALANELRAQGRSW